MAVFWKHSEQLRQRWWSTIIIWRIIPWWLTDHHNCQSFKLFSLWQSQHAVCHCQGKVVTATQLLQCPVIKRIYNIVLLGGLIMGCSPLLLIDVYALFSDVSLRRQASMTQLRNSWPFLLKSDVNLFNHLVRKADVAGCCSAGSVLRWHEVAPYSVSLICIVWSVFTLSWCRSINTIPAS